MTQPAVVVLKLKRFSRNLPHQNDRVDTLGGAGSLHRELARYSRTSTAAVYGLGLSCPARLHSAGVAYLKSYDTVTDEPEFLQGAGFLI